MRIHFIAIGGAAMHNLALALKSTGNHISGSDDEIYEPSKSRLLDAGILPPAFGWFPNKITPDLDAVILGMHARADNPELLKAQELGLKIFSYPEFLFEQTKSKKRVVIGGSHGKTTVTSMIMHVLKFHKVGFDYLVGSQIDGFDRMVEINPSNQVAIFEGDEYLASPIDRRPKFHLYKANIGLITGIAWDHINVFPTFESYVNQFKIFAEGIPEDGCLIYCALDEEIVQMLSTSKVGAQLLPYQMAKGYINEAKNTVVEVESKMYELGVFGQHNLMNLEGARLVCEQLGVNKIAFYEAIVSFKGAAKRLEPIYKDKNFVFYRDFAHSPSKLKATTAAIRNQFADFKTIACMELHTFSSLNENFLNEYKNTLDEAHEAMVYYNPQTIEHKKLKPISPQQVLSAFGRDDLKVFTNSMEMINYLKSSNMNKCCLLMMSSGTFDGVNFKELATQLQF